MTRTRYAPLLALALAGCTPALHGPGPDNAGVRYDAAVEALNRGAYQDAVQSLAWVANHCARHELGIRANMVLAAAALDPRNPERDPATAADASGAVLHDGANADERAMAASLYLLARELGAGYVPATEENPGPGAARPPTNDPAPTMVTGCGASRSLQNDTASATLPVLPGEPVPARLRALRLERGRLDAVADSLDRRLTAVEAQLAEKERELERIRRTLKP